MELRYAEFQEAVAKAAEKSSCFFLKLTPLYKKLNKGDDLKDILMNKFSGIALVLWKLFISPFQKIYYSKKYKNVSFISSLKGEYEFVFMLKSLAPTKYDSQIRILKKLNKPCLIISKTKVLERKKEELEKLDCKIVLWDLEIKRLPFKTYFKKVNINDIFSDIADEEIVKALKKEKNFLELQMKSCDMMYQFYSSLFKKAKPKAIIANSFYGPLGQAAERIRKIGIQHGVISDVEGHEIPAIADEFLIWGSFWEQRAPSWMFRDTKLVPLGCPRFDSIAESKKEYFPGLDVSKKTVIFFSSAEGPENPEGFYDKVIKDIGELRKSLDVNFIVKLHPGGETPDLYEKVLNKEIFDKIIFIQGSKISLHKILQHCDLAIAVSSTALLESMAFKMPVIQFNPDEDLGAMEFAQYGGGKLVRGRSVLMGEARRLLFEDQYIKEVVEKQNQFLDTVLANIGTATEKIINYLTKTD